MSVPVSVVDRHGCNVAGLEPSDFLLVDDGKPRPVRVDTIDSGLAPIALVTLVQTSDITLSALAKIKKVGVMIPEAVVGANGEAAVVTFDDDVKVVQDFTTDADAISQVFRNLKPADTMGGRMIDAVNEALIMLANRPGSRRANHDQTGRLSANGWRIVTRNSRSGPPRKANTVKALTDVTGGQCFRFETKSKLENDLIQVGAEIHNQYLLSFTPDLEQTPQFHKLQVQVKNHPDAMIRARPGYWTTPAGY